jgi:hypothetical protein
MADHGMTEKIISPKVNAVMASTHFWVPVNRRSSSGVSVPAVSASSSSLPKPTSERALSCWTRRA